MNTTASERRSRSHALGLFGQLEEAAPIVEARQLVAERQGLHLVGTHDQGLGVAAALSDVSSGGLDPRRVAYHHRELRLEPAVVAVLTQEAMHEHAAVELPRGHLLQQAAVLGDVVGVQIPSPSSEISSIVKPSKRSMDGLWY